MILGDRLIVINDAYVEQIGTPIDVYQRPATRFVAGFIGSPATNFFKGRLNSDGRSIELRGDVHLPVNGEDILSYLCRPF